MIRTKLGIWGFILLFTELVSSLAFAKGVSDLEGVWKVPSEYPGRSIYFFEVKNGQSHLKYPPEKDFVGQVPHAANSFTAAGPGEFILSPVVQTPDGPQNLFAMLAKQTGLKGFEALAERGLTYRKNDAGELIPQVPDELKVWLPKLVRSTPPVVLAFQASGELFKGSVFRELQMSFPQDEPVATCPEGLGQLLKFSPEAFEEAKKISRFRPNPGTDAQVTEGRSKYTLFVQDSPSERALALYFFEGENAKFPPLKLYRISGNRWVVPNGNRDPVTGALQCQRVSIQPATPTVRGGAPARGTGRGGKPQ